MGRKNLVFGLVIHCGLVAYVVNWALGFSFKIFAYGWSFGTKEFDYPCWGVPLHCLPGSGAGWTAGHCRVFGCLGCIAESSRL